MTDKKRREQIYNAAIKDCELYGEGDHFQFVRGANYADENPKYTKRDFINDAREFLRNTFDEVDYDTVLARMDMERLLWEFEKWMS